MKTARRLAAYKASLSNEGDRCSVEQTRSASGGIRRRHPQEELKKDPHAFQEDIGREPEALSGKKKEVEGVKVIHHKMFTLRYWLFETVV